MIRSIRIAALLASFAGAALAQAAPPLAERTAAAADARAKIAAGEFKLAEERSEWQISCGTDVRTNVSSCWLFSRMLLEDGIALAAIAITLSYVDGAPSFRIASDASFPKVVALQVDTLPVLETRSCTANSCTLGGEPARTLLEEITTGATIYARYEAPYGVFAGRMPLDVFVAKLGEVTH